MSALVLEKGLVHYEAIGRGKGPLVFLHGWLGSWRYWVSTMEELSVSRRNYAFDLWGFGDSDKLRSGSQGVAYTISGYVDLLQDFLDEMGIQQVALVGHALGGLVALRFAARSPDRVQQIMGVSVPITGACIDRSFTAFSGNGQALARLIGRRAGFPEVEREARKTDVDAIVTSVRSATEQNLRDVYLPFRIPVLLVHGGDDPFIQPPTPEFLRGMAENSRVVLFKGVQHFPMLEETNKFNRLLMQFLNAGGDLDALEVKEEWQRRLR
jgi:pimeloyl-ACP methyl ester carboxylesterase